MFRRLKRLLSTIPIVNNTTTFNLENSNNSTKQQASINHTNNNMKVQPTKAIQLIRQNWIPITHNINISNASVDLSFYDPLITAIGDAQIVLIGEASHGTHEFYMHRAAITKRLIMEKGFRCVAWEADFPDAFEVNQYVRNITDSWKGSDQALNGFHRFPVWMWRNTVVKHFIEWLNKWNKDNAKDNADKAGIYGLDLYSADRSMRAVIDYLEQVDKEEAEKAKDYYSCIANYLEKKHYSIPKDCQQKVFKVWKDMVENTSHFMENDENVRKEDRIFYAIQNARVVKNAEGYYRKMYVDGSWNFRDTHMVESLKELIQFYKDHYKRNCKVIIWAHNSHVGNAYHTEMRTVKGDELNIGRLCKEQFPEEKVFNIGFSTHHGTVTAASKWDGKAEYKKVRPGLADSYEKLFYEATQYEEKGSSSGGGENVNVGYGSNYGGHGSGGQEEGHHKVHDFMLLFRSNSSNIKVNEELVREMQKERLQRAIGVIYRPDTERHSHYFNASVSRQFDAMIHLNRTRAIHPLELESEWQQKTELEETYPFAL
ncbi:hypothetical protein ABK040_014970 [Willaertia magna]